MSKEKCNFDVYQKAALKGVLPECASSVDIVKIESLFGKGHKQITSIRDDEGKLLKRVISEYKNDKKISKTISTYDIESDAYRHIERKKYVNGKNVSEIQEAFSVDKGSDNLVGHAKLVVNRAPNGIRQEKQVFEELHKNLDRHFVETEATRLSNGKLVNTRVRSNVGDVEELKKDPYLFFRSYGKTEFLKAIIPYAKKLQSITGRVVNIRDKRITSSALGYSSSFPFYKKVVVDSTKQSKSELVNTLNHEFRHQWQDQLLKDYNFINFFFRKNSSKIAPENQKLARKLWKAEVFYCPSEISYNKYFNNFKEVDARKAGEAAKNEYIEYGRKLADLFPFIDKRLFGIDNTLNDILSAFFNNKAENIKVVELPAIKLGLKN